MPIEHSLTWLKKHWTTAGVTAVPTVAVLKTIVALQTPSDSVYWPLERSLRADITIELLNQYQFHRLHRIQTIYCLVMINAKRQAMKLFPSLGCLGNRLQIAISNMSSWLQADQCQKRLDSAIVCRPHVRIILSRI